MSAFDLGVQLRHALIVKRHLTTNQHVENYTEAPHVDLWASVLSSVQQFWSRKVETAAEGLQQGSWRVEVAQTEIYYFDVTALADQDVFDLQISVDDAIAVTIIEGTCNLTAELSGLLLFQTTMCDDIVEHLTAIDIFEEHVPVIVSPLYISHAAYIWVIE